MLGPDLHPSMTGVELQGGHGQQVSKEKMSKTENFAAQNMSRWQNMFPPTSAGSYFGNRQVVKQVSSTWATTLEADL